MQRVRRSVCAHHGLVVAVAGALVLASLAGTAYAAFFHTINNSGNTFSTDTLDPAGTPVSVHTSVLGGMTTLTWAASADSYGAGYRIDRATTPGGTYQTIAKIPLGVGTGVTEYGGFAAGSQPSGIANGPDGNVWVTELAANKIAKVSPTDGSILAEYTVPTASSQPKDIVWGPDDNLWFTETNANKIGKVTTSGTFTEYTVTTASSQPNSITVGPDGNLWFTEFNARKVAKITTGGTITEYSTTTLASQPYGIKAGPDGNLWFAESGVNKIAKVTTAGTFTETALAASSAPKGVATAP